MSKMGLLERVLEPGALGVVFQPVYEVHDSGLRPHYVEGLIRGPRDTSLEPPEILFEYARNKGREVELDRCCIATLLQAARRLPEPLRLGINVHASTLARDPEFLAFLGDTAAAAGIDVERLVFEIVEHVLPWDLQCFRTALEGLREIGVAIALDDVGRGQSNYMMILECRPHYFKIDRYFVHGAGSDFYRTALLASVAQLAFPFGARVVAEGVESQADLQAVCSAGIGLVQGFLFGQPGPDIKELNVPSA